MEMNTQRIRMAVMLLLSVLLAPLTSSAQDVTISPTTGTILAALTGGSEGGSERGWGSTWRHEQLPLTFTIGDFGVLTAGGELRYPAGNMILNDGKNHTGEGGYNMTTDLYTSRTFDKTNGNYVIMGGYCSDIFMALSLPKGYRFTGYEIVVANNMMGASNFGGWSSYNAQNKILYEAKDLTYNAAVTDAVAAQYSYSDLYDHCDDVALYSAISGAIENGDENYLAVAKHRVNGVVDEDAWEMGTTNSNDDYVISRTSQAQDGSDMGNHLYFRVSHSESGTSSNRTWVGLTIKSITVYFTAEGDFTETVSTTASTVFNGGKNYVNSPFATGKVDLGNVSQDVYGHYTYKVLNQTDLLAYNTLFEEGAVSGGSLPATPGEGGITSEVNGGNYYYGLKNNTYYVECPTSVTASSGEDSPIGFRIIGANVNYTYGTAAAASSQTTHEMVQTDFGVFSLYYDYNSSNRFYLGAGQRYSSNPTEWFLDGEGYCRCGANGSYYLTLESQTIGSSWSATTYRYLTTTIDKSKALKFKKNGNYLQVSGGTYDSYYVCYRSQNDGAYSWGLRDNYRQNPVVINSLGTKSIPVEVVGTTTLPAFTPAPYTLVVYGADGETIVDSVSVNSTNAEGTIPLANLNNDAIKFKIRDMEGTNSRALITVELVMQTLDPYINRMSVVCSDPQTNVGTDEKPEPLRIWQTFTASDFSVSGGSFHFNLPATCKDHTVGITFEDLFSDYADESYTFGSVTNFSRYNFVKSDHYNAFGESNNNIYTNKSEAADPQEERLKVGIVGNKPFKFNNAEEVASGSADFYVEYPFSLEDYAAAPNNGSFSGMNFTVSETTQPSTGYVFTTDETAYNIAPTTTTQHRSYAFYKMDVSVASATYTAQVEFKPVYTTTLNGEEKTDAYYGAVVTAPYTEGGKTYQGYATTDEIFAKIEEKIADESVTVKPIDAKHLLYLDFSQLAGIFQITTEQHGSMEDYSNTNAPNCLIFLPVGASAPNNNVAYKTTSGSYHAAHNIVLTDKEPFFSPYDITIGAGMAYYERKVTLDKYGKVQNASLLMPFAVTIDADGVHTNEDGSTFTLYNMQPENSLSVSAEDELVTSYYIPATKKMGNVSQANYPYIVRLDNVDNDPNHDYSFVVSQKGATIKATTGMNSDYTITGDEATGSVDKGAAAGNYKFTGIGTLAGIHVKKSDGIFYFAKNQFWSSLDLNRPNVSIYPFRAYYKTEQTANATPSSLQVFFGKNENNFEDAIRDLQEKQMDMSVRAGRGTLTITSATDNQVRINGISGVSHYNLNLGAGETKTVSVPAGIYVVNGVKILVK